MAGSDDDWAGNSVPWNPELPVFEPSHNLLLESGPWTVPYADFTPPPSPFALEMRSETIEQLVGGDALRRGESERIEAGRSEENSDVVAGRDRVRVQGTLHEHTGHGLAEQVAHLDTTVDGRLDVHTGNEDMVLLAGHMKDIWDGGTAIVAAMTDDLVAGGGVRVTAPLDLWVHGLMGVEERIGTCTADAVLMELGATHYEREYGPGVHAAGLAVYNGSLYLSNRSSFRPLMRVSSGVRNLIAGGGSGGAGDGAGDGAGSAPGASPPLAPAAGGAGTEAVSETLSAATGGARSVEAVVEVGPRPGDLTGLQRLTDAPDEMFVDELERAYQGLMAGMESTLDSVGSFDDGSYADDLSALTRSTNSAEQLAGLRRGEIPVASLESIHPSAHSGADDVHRAGGPSDAHPPIAGYEAVGAGGLEPFDLGYEVVRDGPYRIASDSGSVSSLDGGSSLHSESGYNPPPMPAITVDHVADSHGRVILDREAYENIQRGDVLLRVVDARGHELAQGSYTLVVEGYEIAETNVLYRRVARAADRTKYADVVDLSTSFPASLSDDAPALPPRSLEALEISDPTSLSPPAPADPGASPLAGLAEVDETQVGLTGRGGSPDTNRRERLGRFGSMTVLEYEQLPRDWQGGRRGTSSGQGGIGFGRLEVEGERPPEWQADETPGFGGAHAPPQDRRH